MPAMGASGVGCAVTFISGMYLVDNDVDGDRFLKQCLVVWPISSPILIFAQNESSKTNGGRAFANYIQRNKLGKLTEMTCPDNGVHLGSGPVTLWSWLVDYEAVAKRAFDGKWEMPAWTKVGSWEKKPEHCPYLSFANSQNTVHKDAKTLGLVQPEPETPPEATKTAAEKVSTSPERVDKGGTVNIAVDRPKARKHPTIKRITDDF